MKHIIKIGRSVRYALRGLRRAYRLDLSFRLELWYGIPAYLIIGYALAPFSEPEFFFFVFSYLFILAVELLNTSIETLLARLHPDEHELIGHSKDIASAAVLTAFFFAGIVLGVLVLKRLAPEVMRYIIA
jgi:diacylglycerol kinase